MFYTIYKITNQIDGKFYIGSHKTKDLNDAYMGSGKYLKYAQEKYGILNFTKEILFVFNNPGQMYAKEAEIVNKDFLVEENTYNLKVGGFGGWDHENQNTEKQQAKSIKGNAKQKWLAKNDLTWQGNINKSIAAAKHMKKLHTLGLIKYNTFLGKSHTELAKKNIGEKNSKLQSGEGNSQYGTRWIYSIEMCLSKKIQKEDPLPEGWIEGRKIKFIKNLERGQDGNAADC